MLLFFAPLAADHAEDHREECLTIVIVGMCCCLLREYSCCG